MTHNFKSVKALLVSTSSSSQKILAGVLRVLGIGVIDTAFEATDAYSKYKTSQHTLIFADIQGGGSDAIALAKKIRASKDLTNTRVPILGICGPRFVHLANEASQAGVTDLLQAPYSVTDIKTRLDFLLHTDTEELYAQNTAYQNAVAAHTQAEEIQKSWPDEEESASLTELLLDQYIKHHEIVFMKLKFAQTATKKSIEQVRDVHQKIKSQNPMDLQTFNAMWENIIQIFIEGGVSEDDLFKIENLITKIPSEIKTHYDELSQKDKNFLDLVESFNQSAYQKAREKVMALQKQPNPLSGKTSGDYSSQKTPAQEARVKFFDEALLK